jgi:hypothetical protein
MFFVNVRVICSDAVAINLCSRRYLYLFVRLPQFCGVALVILSFEFAQRLVNSKRRNLSFYYAECKDTWDVPRDSASDLCFGSRGHCPIITRGLVALFFLLYFPNALLYTCCLYCRGLLLLCCSFLWVQ